MHSLESPQAHSSSACLKPAKLQGSLGTRPALVGHDRSMKTGRSQLAQAGTSTARIGEQITGLMAGPRLPTGRFLWFAASVSRVSSIADVPSEVSAEAQERVFFQPMLCKTDWQLSVD